MNPDTATHPRQQRMLDRIIYVLCGLAGVSVLLDLAIHRHEVLGFAESFGFYAWFGFAACLVLVLVARGLRRVLMRAEDYYGDEV